MPSFYHEQSFLASLCDAIDIFEVVLKLKFWSQYIRIARRPEVQNGAEIRKQVRLVALFLMLVQMIKLHSRNSPLQFAML